MQKTLTKPAKRHLNTGIIYNNNVKSSNLLSKIINISELPLSFLAEKVLEVTPKTLNKYRRENVELTSLVREHTQKFLELYKFGLELFGNNSEFNKWLMDESFGLGYKIPADMLNTSNGLELVYDELTRIAYGATA